MPKHLCHAIGCSAEVPPRMLMCYPHWMKVPKDYQAEVWRYYVPGQETRKDPTTDYVKAMTRAVIYVARLEKQTVWIPAWYAKEEGDTSGSGHWEPQEAAQIGLFRA